MNVIVRILSADYEQIKSLSHGRYYLRGKMNEADGEVVALQRTVDAYPTEAEIARIEAEAAVEWQRMSRENVARIVAGLKQQLADTDYKVIKNSEWANAQAMANNGVIPSVDEEGWPYDPVQLHAERQALRDEINEYENAED